MNTKRIDNIDRQVLLMLQKGIPISKSPYKDLADRIGISDSKIGFTAFQKKPEFGPGSIQASNISMDKVQIPYLLEENSILSAEGKKLKASRRNVQEILYGVEFRKPSK